MELDDALVGVRVVVRSVLPGETGPSGGPAYTDVVGVVESVDDEELAVRHRDGTLRPVRRAHIVIVKRLPPPPPRREPRAFD